MSFRDFPWFSADSIEFARSATIFICVCQRQLWLEFYTGTTAKYLENIELYFDDTLSTCHILKISTHRLKWSASQHKDSLSIIE